MVHGGKNNLIENNIIVDCPIGIYYTSGGLLPRPEAKFMVGFAMGNRYRHNIFYNIRNQSFHFDVPSKEYEYMERQIAESEYNIFFDTSGRYNIYDEAKRNDGENLVYPLSKWQELGHDNHSMIADPLFVDPTNEDYRLKPESPAFKLGFQPIPVERIGIQADHAKSIEGR